MSYLIVALDEGHITVEDHHAPKQGKSAPAYPTITFPCSDPTADFVVGDHVDIVLRKVTT